MAGPPLIALEVVIGFVVPVGWGVWELMSLRRDKRRQQAAAAAASADPATKPEAVTRGAADSPIEGDAGSG